MNRITNKRKAQSLTKALRLSATLTLILAILVLLAPAQLPGLAATSESEGQQQYTQVVNVTAGYNRTYAIMEDGTVWAFGSNTHFELGDGTNTHRAFPINIPELIDIVDIAVTRYGGIALGLCGTVYEWRGGRFQTGIPEPVADLAGVPVIAIASGNDHYLALDNFGNVYSWGSNEHGQLSRETSSYDNNDPEQIYDLPHNAIVGIAATKYASFFLDVEGNVWRTGDMIPDWVYAPANYLPMIDESISDVTAIHSGMDNAFATDSNGDVWQLTPYDHDYYEVVPAMQIGISNITSIASNELMIIASNHNGEVWEMPLMSGVFDQIYGLHDISKVSIGESHYAALGHYDYLWVWGSGSFGQLGTGNFQDSDEPIQIIVGIEPPEKTWMYQLDITEGREAILPINAIGIENFYGMTITISYDDSVLELKNIAAHVHGTHLYEGEIPGTGLIIAYARPGVFDLVLDKDIPWSMTYSGVITLLRFYELTTGTTTVTVSLNTNLRR